MTTYYNEHDPKAVLWLRELIAKGLIPAGHVDDRSICDVKPEDLEGFTQCHFFAGVAGWSLALRIAGYPDDEEAWSASCPCQPFSGAGLKKGKKDERHLWPELRRLNRACRPALIFGEQVASADGRNWLGGYEGMQGLLDNKTVVGFLRSQGMFKELPSDLQNLLLRNRTIKEIQNTEVGEVETIHPVEEEEPSKGADDAGEVSCETKRSSFLVGGEAYSRCDRCGRVRVDEDSIRPRSWQDVEQSLFGQDRLDQGIYARKCPCGAVLHQRDGEHLGREQDHRNVRGDNDPKKVSLGEPSKQIERLSEEEIESLSVTGIRVDLENMEYEFGCSDLCSAGIGSPNIRQRLYWVAESKHKQWRRRNRARARQEARDRGEQDRLADAEGQRRSTGEQPGAIAEEKGNGTRRLRASRHSEDGGVGNTEGDEQRRVADGAHGPRESAGGSGDERRQKWMGSPIQSGLEGHTGDVNDGSEPGRLSAREAGPASETGKFGFWSDFRWHPCTDGKQRRVPAESVLQRVAPGFSDDLDVVRAAGAFPLSPRIPGRVALLRGYGNAINPQLAAEFICAYLEVTV